MAAKRRPETFLERSPSAMIPFESLSVPSALSINPGEIIGEILHVTDEVFFLSPLGILRVSSRRNVSPALRQIRKVSVDDTALPLCYDRMRAFKQTSFWQWRRRPAMPPVRSGADHHDH